jgi:hypothetical protein
MIGRSRTCTIRLAEPEVSGEHALLRWRNGIWELQDLHSRNGTYVDGRAVGAGQRVGLEERVELGFGRAGGYILSDAGPPQAFAMKLDDPSCTIEAEAGLLGLPDPAQPELSIYHRGQGWWMEIGDDLRPVDDAEVVQASDGAWRVYLPERLAQTYEIDDRAPSLASITLRFGVSDDEQYVELVALHGERVIDLVARAHHLPLLLLARARLDDRALPLAQQGWVYQDDLVRQLATDASRLHVDIHRARRQLAEAGIAEAEHIVERRPGTRQLRLGIGAVEIVGVERKRTLGRKAKPASGSID